MHLPVQHKQPIQQRPRLMRLEVRPACLPSFEDITSVLRLPPSTSVDRGDKIWREISILVNFDSVGSLVTAQSAICSDPNNCLYSHSLICTKGQNSRLKVLEKVPKKSNTFSFQPKMIYRSAYQLSRPCSPLEIWFKRQMVEETHRIVDYEFWRVWEEYFNGYCPATAAKTTEKRHLSNLNLKICVIMGWLDNAWALLKIFTAAEKKIIG